MHKTLVRCLLLVTLWALVGIAPALAQYNAGFEGVVSDSTGAVVPGVKVVARNVATGIDYSDTSNTAGVYHITNLPQGTYILKAEREGFVTAQTDPLDLHTEGAQGCQPDPQCGQRQADRDRDGGGAPAQYGAGAAFPGR